MPDESRPAPRVAPALPPAPALPASRNPLRLPHETRSLFGEILDWMLAPLLLLWPITITITYLVAQNIANAPFDRQLERSALLLAQQVREQRGQAQLTPPLPVADLVGTDALDEPRFMVLGLRGELIAGEPDLPLPPEEEPTAIGEVRMRDAEVRGTPMRVAALWVRLTDRSGAQPILVQVAERTTRREQLTNDIMRSVIVPQFVVLPLAVALVWFGLSRGLAPLNLLLARVRARRPNDLSPVERHAAPEELGPLVDAFNELLRRLNENLATQKRFLAHAAHQMKTPLAGLRTQAELAQRQTDPQELKRSLRQIAAAAGRSAHLIDQLLALARAEHQAAENTAFVTVDLTVLARDLVRDLVPQALARGLDFGVETPGAPAIVVGHPLLLRELLSNLADNALRYTPAGGQVTVRVRVEAQRVLAEVEDNGPGIPVAERQLVFEPFYRVLGTDADGSGLGLAIVNEIATRHGARLSIENHPATTDPAAPGTLVRVEFAAAPI
ncbi:MAG: sensor histidine kinase N-terminal domain-containing protein [Burkholderiales bacterium]|jgi:two-component system sensor histidine kinase TctE|nr:sensor histidine kinase N-terminal domain-containing protein [Burkholderiales bacterium]